MPLFERNQDIILSCSDVLVSGERNFPCPTPQNNVLSYQLCRATLLLRTFSAESRLSAFRKLAR